MVSVVHWHTVYYFTCY